MIAFLHMKWRILSWHLPVSEQPIKNQCAENVTYISSNGYLYWVTYSLLQGNTGSWVYERCPADKYAICLVLR